VACGEDVARAPSSPPSLPDQVSVSLEPVREPAPSEPPPRDAFEPPLSGAAATGSWRLSASDRRGCAVTPTGDAWCWGWSCSATFARAARVDFEGAVAEVAVARNGDACARRRDGTIACQIEAPFGQYQDEQDPTFPTVPLSVGLFGLESSAPAWCSLDAAGAVWCWGTPPLFGFVGASEMNVFGRPGEASDVALQVPGLPRFRAISGAISSACGLAVDGEVSCWGQVVHDDDIVVYDADRPSVRTLRLGSPSLLVAGAYRGCITSSEGIACFADRSIECRNPDCLRDPVSGHAAPAYQRVADGTVVQLGFSCALFDSGDLWCARGAHGESAPCVLEHPAIVLRDVHAFSGDVDRGCALVDANGDAGAMTVQCWGGESLASCAPAFGPFPGTEVLRVEEGVVIPAPPPMRLRGTRIR
jgi:hypothetical protein